MPMPCAPVNPALAPSRPTNAPGLPALAYRVGTHATFLQRMLARLRTQGLPSGAAPDGRPLAALSTRAQDDPAIALLDAWAMVADVITFYQERIANEGYLRTATERRSMLELARAVGYELNPGVAASAFLAFTVDEAPGTPPVVTIPPGTPVQSIPSPGDLPQTFETGAPHEARAAWNALTLRPVTRPQAIGAETVALRLQGLNTRLQPGDVLLISGAERAQDPTSMQWYCVTLQTVTPRPQEGYTLVAWNKPLQDQAGHALPANPQVFALRQRAAPFGHNAPDWRIMGAPIKQAYVPTYDPQNPATDPQEWPDFALRTSPIDLDTVYPQILADSWAVLVSPGQLHLYRVTEVTTGSRMAFTLNARTTRLTLDTATGLPQHGLRDTTVLAQSEPLVLAEMPGAAALPAGSTRLPLDRQVPGLQVGQFLVLSGQRLEAPGDTVREVVALAGSTDQDGSTMLSLRSGVQYSYVRCTVTLNANVVRATHGETVAQEVLGSGDGAQANQRFVLHRPPLTYVAAATASGAVSTLEVRVNAVRWQEVPSLYGLQARSQSYMLRRDEAGRTAVIFGDGLTGARLPSGQENVVATYRSGIGLAGNVAAGTLSLMPARPAGLRTVTNPLAASGGASPETLEAARDRVPRTVLTLERIVSQQDYEDFARSFAGVGKVQATTMWTGATRLIHLTIADAAGQSLAPNAALVTSLAQAIRTVGNPLQRVVIQSYTPRYFRLEAAVVVDPRYLATAVMADVQAALTAAFHFEQRAFGQGVAASEVITIVQGVPGVVAVDLDRLFFQEDPPALQPTLLARAAYLTRDTAETLTPHPAEFLLLDPDHGMQITARSS